MRPSVNYPLLNGDLECELREYKIFDGSYKDMKAEGGSIRNEGFRAADKDRGQHRPRFEETFKKRDGESDGAPRERRSRRDDGDRPRRSFGARRDDDRSRRGFGPRRDDNTRMGRNEYFHSTKHADMVVRHQEPTLGKENERPIIHGRRNGWKRREE